MAEPYNYLGLLGGPDSLRIAPVVQDAITGQQVQQQNANKLLIQNQQLDEAKRADEARKAMATIATTPNLDDTQFEQLLAPIAQADPNAAQQMRAQRQMSGHLAQVMQDPNPRNIGMFSMRYPEMGKQIETAYSTMNKAEQDSVFRTATDAYGMLMNGNAEGAGKLVQAHIDADKAAGINTSAYESLAQMIHDSPKQAAGLAGMMIVGRVGPEKFGEAFKNFSEGKRSDALLPSDVAIKQTEAQYAPQKAESDLASADATRTRMAAQTANEIVANQISQGRLALDTEALATNTQLKLAELDQGRTNLDAGASKLVNDSAAASTEATMLADREEDLASRVEHSGMQGNILGNTAEFWKSVTGSQDGYTQLRAEWAQIKNNAALANRRNMPGAMSDADRNFLLQGFPANNADPKYIAKFLKTMAKAQRSISAFEDSKAVWVSQNRNLGPASGPLVINGMRIPKGMTFAQAQSALSKITRTDLPGDAQGVVERSRK